MDCQVQELSGKRKSYSSLTKSTFNFPFWIFTKMKFAFSLCVESNCSRDHLKKKKNCLFPTALWKRNSPRGKVLTKIIFPQKRSLWICPFFYFLTLLSGIGAEVCAENLRPASSLFPAWFVARESPCCQATEPGQWDVATSWWENCVLRPVRLYNIGISPRVVFLFKYIMIICVNYWKYA